MSAFPKLKDRSELYRALVRGTNTEPVTTENRICDFHGETTHHYVAASGEAVCERCVARSQVLSEIGRQGGKVGGASKTPKKLEAFRRAAAKRWVGREVNGGRWAIFVPSES